MKQYNPSDIINVALVGHGSSGKTSLAEAMLFLCKETERMGKVNDSTTFTDFDPEEKKRKISLSASIVSTEFEGKKLNIIDAPGLFDFAAGMHEAVRAADTALIVLSGKSGLNVGSEIAYDLAAENNIPRAFFIGKLNSGSAHFYKVMSQLVGKYGSKICPVVVPSYDGENLVGYVNLINKTAFKYDGLNETPIELPNNADVNHMFELLYEEVASQDEELMDKYFSGEELTSDDIIKGIKAGIMTGDLHPVFAGAGLDGQGVALSMKVMMQLLPTADMRSEVATLDNDDEIELKCDTNGPDAAIVFKTVADPFVGKLSVFKVVSGKISPSEKIINARTGEEQRINKVVALKGGKQIDSDVIPAGDIGAVAKLADVVTGDTLCQADKKLALKPAKFPAPVLSMAVYAVKKGDEEKIALGFARLMEEDPTITYILNKETGEQILSGLGEQHLDVIGTKLKNKFQTEIKLVAPRVAYRETIRKKFKVQGKHKKQSGGHGQFGDVWMEFEPCEGTDVIFEEKVFGGSVPKNFFPAVEKGIRDSAVKGVLAGYPVVGIKATLVDGSYHPVDSSEMSFKMAASLAYKAGLPLAMPVLLEPIGILKVIIPDDCMGDVIGDINKRRGRVLGMNPAEKQRSEVIAEVPMAEMADFATAMRSVTQGRSTFTLEFERYDEAPSNITQKIIEESSIDDE
ncbi:MAG: elongation factor G [Clostridia bacterium]|nr:elongation factor G [Clostridia bacterium]